MGITLTNEDIKKKIDLETQVFEALEILRSDGLLCAALENAYVLIADPSSSAAVLSLKSLKRFQEDIYFPLLVADVDSLNNFSPSVTPSLRLIALEFWPGPLNIEVKARSGLAWTLGATAVPPTLIVRSPSNKFLKGVLGLSGPLLYTPASTVGGKPPRDTSEVSVEINNQVKMTIDTGPCKLVGIASTVSFVTDQPKLTREGSIKFFDINKILPTLRQN